MTEEEIEELIDFISLSPMAGDEIKGTGGCRKLRIAGRGKGKRGGYRTITFYSGEAMPVYLITVFGKGERSDLSQGQRNELRKLTSILVEDAKAKVVPAKKGRRQTICVANNVGIK
jgi:hypothetical protein